MQKESESESESEEKFDYDAGSDTSDYDTSDDDTSGSDESTNNKSNHDKFDREAQLSYVNQLFYNEIIKRLEDFVREKMNQPINQPIIAIISNLPVLPQILNSHNENEVIITSEELHAIPETIQQELLNNQHAISNLIESVHRSSRDNLTIMDSTDRNERRIRRIRNFSNQLTTMDPAVRTTLLANQYNVAMLMEYAYYDLDQLATMDPAIRTELLENSISITTLIRSALSNTRDSEILYGSMLYTSLKRRTQLFIEQLFAMDPAIRAELLNYANNVEQLILSTKLTLDKLIVMKPEVRTELVQNSSKIEQLIRFIDISLCALLIIDPVIRTELYQYTSSIITLIRHHADQNFSLQEFVKLDRADRRTLLSNPDSRESARIITHIKALQKLQSEYVPPVCFSNIQPAQTVTLRLEEREQINDAYIKTLVSPTLVSDPQASEFITRLRTQINN